MFDRVLAWWHAHRPHRHLLFRSALPHVMPPVVRVPVNGLPENGTATALTEARAIAAVPPVVAVAIKSLLKQRGTWQMKLVDVEREHPDSAHLEVYVTMHADVIEVGVYMPSREVKRLLPRVRAERESLECALLASNLTSEG